MMSFNVIFPMLLASAGTGLSCGLSCGACGTPVINIFLSAYLFTHSGKMKRSLTSFLGFHAGKAVSVSLLCVLISWFGSQIVDESGKLLGIDLQNVVYAAMLIFLFVLIWKWIQEQKSSAFECCNGACHKKSARQEGFLPMLVYGLISGLSPCASLILVLGYAASLRTMEAILIGLCFSLANSIVPLVLLVLLTGVLSREMFCEIPQKIKYFQLATYCVFAAVLVHNIVSSFI